MNYFLTRFLTPRLRHSLLCFTVALSVVNQTACLKGSEGASVALQARINIPAAPTTPAALDTPVRITRRPATFGFPLKETANVRDASKITLRDATGKAVPAQFRVLSRWRGTLSDTGRPIKWLLVDADTAPGDYKLTLGNDAPKPAAPITATEGNIVQVNSSRLKLRLPKQGTGLLSALELDGAERLKQPVTITMELARMALLVGKAFAAKRELRVSDASALRPGDRVRFENIGSVAFDVERSADHFIEAAEDEFEPGHTYRIDEGTPRAEDVLVARRDDSGRLYPVRPLLFPHPTGARVRDLTAEAEKAVVQSINGQTVMLAAPLKNVHGVYERIVVDDPAATPLRLVASADETRVEESGALRTVIRQDGHFQAESSKSSVAVTPLRFTLRYHVYAAQPFVRLQLRMVNTGAFGFGGDRTQQPPFASQVLLTALSVDLPMVIDSLSAPRTQREEARRGPGKTSDKRLVTVSVATSGASARNVEISVPEFAENFPKALTADAHGLRFDILPPIELPGQKAATSKSASQPSAISHQPSAELPSAASRSFYIFDGARAKTTEFYLGQETKTAAAMTNTLAAAINPAYLAESKAVRPAMVERRDWRQVFAADKQMTVSAARYEKWLAGSYDRAADEDGASLFEYRENGKHYGWRNFGDVEWGDGFNNVHYDLPYILLREALRTGDARAFQIGSEMARYRADWGQVQADDYWDSGHTWNLRGMAFYEKGDHGTYREPVPSHHWIEGLWLYWALTGDEAVHQSAIESSETMVTRAFTFEYSLSWGESRWVGWPLLAMVVAWRYSGEMKYLDKAALLTNLLVRAEEDYGRKGYFVPPGSSYGNCVHPFMWAGYSQLGIIEYWRETGDPRIAEFIVRVADWLVRKTPGQPPVLMGGVSKPDGTYEPIGAPNQWCTNKVTDEPLVAQSMMNLPTLAVAAQISGRADLRDKARQLFRDVTWFRDIKGAAGPAEQSFIAFRSRTYPGSAPKVYGQFGLFVPEYFNVTQGK